MTTTATASPSAERDDQQPLDIEALFPADPDLMTSPEGDERGLRELQAAARQRREELGR
jgi:hypothetical protein